MSHDLLQSGVIGLYTGSSVGRVSMIQNQVVHGFESHSGQRDFLYILLWQWYTFPYNNVGQHLSKRGGGGWEGF